MQKPEIILVDDHPLFRQVLKSFLSTENIATVIGEASNGMEFVQLLPVLKPDLVIMDIDMPVMNGLEAIQKALKLRPALKIVACTMFMEEESYSKMIET
ncbi:MAG TPA: response regulator transcription factor, partial [Prolixibacteraceae bacterium]|nr:response regulator transcription factor [Prolixibacteraceae bacterium]